ncbi:MAG: archaellin/type IV pilin N-terminal domain-containing protein [Candidatus Pacearchaeota archaeon]
MKVDNKRGLSDIVTTVLLVLLAIAAIGIIWVVIQNFINTGTKGIGTTADCFQNTFEVVSALNVSTSTSSSVNVTVKRISGQSSIDKLLFYYTSLGETTKKIETTNISSVGETRVVTVPIASSGGALKQGDSVQVAAVIGGTACNPSEKKLISGI